MKLLLILLICTIIILKTPEQTVDCNLDTIKQAMPVRIFSESKIDGSKQSVIVTRFLHNKVGIFLSEFSKCYFGILDPRFIFDSTSIFGLVFLVYFFYKMISFKIFPLILSVLVIPIISIFKLPLIIAIVSFKIFAIIGLVVFVNHLNKINIRPFGK